MPYTQPEFNKTAFNCPNCNAYAEQKWYRLERSGKYSGDKVEGAYTSTCSHCGRYTIWINKVMIYPLVNGVPNPHSEMPDDIKKDYEEARSIVARSSRGAAALLRLAIQKLTDILLTDKKGKDLNDNIRILVEKGLPEKIQKALDYLRVIGNNAVHPGLIDMKDNREVANLLFELLNIIVDVMISQPKKIEGLYGQLPEKDKLNIQKRDNPETPK
jgi:predicted RNA-binding Zn-ribbon protein involved in translation (DUF1610 family)